MRFVVPTARAKASISSTPSPVIAAAHSGVRDCEMRLQFVRAVGVLREIVPVGMAVAEADMHHRAGERRVGAGLEAEADIGLLHRLVAVDVDDRDPRPALLPRADRVGHDVDLGRDRVGAPDDDEVGLRHLARVGPGEPARCRRIAGLGRIGADRVELAANSAWRGAAGGCRRAAPAPWCRHSDRATPPRRRAAPRPSRNASATMSSASSQPIRSQALASRQSALPFSPFRRRGWSSRFGL